MDILAKIQAAGLDLDQLPGPGGSYAPVNLRGSVAYVAIQLSEVDS